MQININKKPQDILLDKLGLKEYPGVYGTKFLVN
jgi:hypothetical protein